MHFAFFFRCHGWSLFYVVSHIEHLSDAWISGAVHFIPTLYSMYATTRDADGEIVSERRKTKHARK